MPLRVGQQYIFQINRQQLEMTDYQEQYNQKCQQFNELNEQFLAYQDQSALMIEEVESENNLLRTKVKSLEDELESLKEKRKSQANTLEKELELIKRQRNQFKTRFQDFHRKVVELQNINETLESENRAANTMLSEYETRVEKTMEELALLQMQLQENKSTNQEHIARLKNQLKQTEEELYVLHLKHQKHNDDVSQRRSRLSSSASFSSQEDISRIIGPIDEKNQDINFNSILSFDFKRNKQVSMGKTISLVKNLIYELDDKAKRMRLNKKQFITTLS